MTRAYHKSIQVIKLKCECSPEGSGVEKKREKEEVKKRSCIVDKCVTFRSGIDFQYHSSTSQQRSQEIATNSKQR